MFFLPAFPLRSEQYFLCSINWEQKKRKWDRVLGGDLEMQISLIKCTVTEKRCGGNEWHPRKKTRMKTHQHHPARFPHHYRVWLMAFASPVQLEYITEWLSRPPSLHIPKSLSKPVWNMVTERKWQAEKLFKSYTFGIRWLIALDKDL